MPMIPGLVAAQQWGQGGNLPSNLPPGVMNQFLGYMNQLGINPSSPDARGQFDQISQAYDAQHGKWDGFMNMVPYAAMAAVAPYAIGALGAGGGAGAAGTAAGVGGEAAPILTAGEVAEAGAGTSLAASTLPEITVTGAAGGAGGLAAAAAPAVGAFAGTQMAGQGSPGGAQEPAGFNWGSLLGPLISGAGSYLGNQQAGNSAEAAARMAVDASRPFGVNIPGFGQSQFDMANRTATLTPEQQLQQFQQQGGALSQMGYNGLMGSGNPLGQSGFGNISPQLQGMFTNYQNSQYNTPGANIYGDQASYNGLMTNAAQGAGNLLSQSASFNPQDRAKGYLDSLNAQAGFSEGQATQNNLESQFGKGILASTAGQYQTQALNNSLQQNQMARQMQAQQMALNDQSSMTQNAQQALGGYQNLQSTGFNQGYQNNLFGNNAANQMFGNALGLFGAGMNSQQQQFGQQNALYNQGQANNLNVGSYLSSLLGLGGNLGNLASGASGAAAGIMANQGQASGNALAGFFNNMGSSVDWGSIFGKKP